MAYVIIEVDDFTEIRERLKAGKLTEDDVKLLDLLVSRAQRAAEISVTMGRLTVDQLPFGMDIIK